METEFPDEAGCVVMEQIQTWSCLIRLPKCLDLNGAKVSTRIQLLSLTLTCLACLTLCVCVRVLRAGEEREEGRAVLLVLELERLRPAIGSLTKDRPA